MLRRPLGRSLLALPFGVRDFTTSTKQKNPYKVLGVKNGATAAEVKKAYRVLAKKLHPDAPGGNAERFQEVHDAYEQVKTGTWIPKSGDGSPGSGPANRYEGFEYQTSTHKKVTYDEFFREMHTGKTAQPNDEAAEASKKRRANPLGASDETVQAWFRLIFVWGSTFMFLRIALMILFPPKRDHHKKKQIRPLPVKQ